MNEEPRSFRELQARIEELEYENNTLRSAAQQNILHVLEATKIAALQEFIGDVSHDLRTPLTSIRASIYLLRKLTDPIKRSHHIDVLEHQARHLEELIDNLLSMTRLDNDITEFKLRKIQVNDVIEEILANTSPIAIQKDLYVDVDLAPDMPPLLIDRLKILRALVNLVDNAMMFTPEGGSIFIRTSYAYDHQEIVIEIGDTGIGIEEEHIPHIFQRFYRVEKSRNSTTGGSGLGLAITQKIIERHTGRIEVESQPGVGSVFRVFIPTLPIGFAKA